MTDLRIDPYAAIAELAKREPLQSSSTTSRVAEGRSDRADVRVAVILNVVDVVKDFYQNTLLTKISFLKCGVATNPRKKS